MLGAVGFVLLIRVREYREFAAGPSRVRQKEMALRAALDSPQLSSGNFWRKNVGLGLVGGGGWCVVGILGRRLDRRQRAYRSAAARRVICGREHARVRVRRCPDLQLLVRPGARAAFRFNPAEAKPSKKALATH